MQIFWWTIHGTSKSKSINSKERLSPHNLLLQSVNATFHHCYRACCLTFSKVEEKKKLLVKANGAPLVHVHDRRVDIVKWLNHQSAKRKTLHGSTKLKFAMLNYIILPLIFHWCAKKYKRESCTNVGTLNTSKNLRGSNESPIDNSFKTNPPLSQTQLWPPNWEPG